MEKELIHVKSLQQCLSHRSAQNTVVYIAIIITVFIVILRLLLLSGYTIRVNV